MNDGVAKIAHPGVVAAFRDLDMLCVCLLPRKTATPRGAQFLFSHRKKICETFMDRLYR